VPPTQGQHKSGPTAWSTPK